MFNIIQVLTCHGRFGIRTRDRFDSGRLFDVALLALVTEIPVELLPDEVDAEEEDVAADYQASNHDPVLQGHRVETQS